MQRKTQAYRFRGKGFHIFGLLVDELIGSAAKGRVGKLHRVSGKRQGEKKKGRSLNQTIGI